MIDAISRSVHKQQRKREENNEGPHELDGYLKRFAIVLKDDALNGCFEPCSAKDKVSFSLFFSFFFIWIVYSTLYHHFFKWLTVRGKMLSRSRIR